MCTAENVTLAGT